MKQIEFWFKNNNKADADERNKQNTERNAAEELKKGIETLKATGSLSNVLRQPSEMMKNSDLFSANTHLNMNLDASMEQLKYNISI